MAPKFEVIVSHRLVQIQQEKQDGGESSCNKNKVFIKVKSKISNHPGLCHCEQYHETHLHYLTLLHQLGDEIKYRKHQRNRNQGDSQESKVINHKCLKSRHDEVEEAQDGGEEELQN